MTTSPNPYRGFRFQPEVIEDAVWLYHCFSLSLRDVELTLGHAGPPLPGCASPYTGADIPFSLTLVAPGARAHRQRSEFAPDSPLEQRRFELMVPPRTPAFRGRHMGPATAPGFGVAPS
jgi:hypothetical protein